MELALLTNIAALCSICSTVAIEFNQTLNSTLLVTGLSRSPVTTFGYQLTGSVFSAVPCR
jgi:hypothetical protein